jgi:ATP:cob(I)alamin adenosyltransferase
MSIATKTGDKGTTGTLFGARIIKSDKTIHAVGDIDELNAALGMVKAQIKVKADSWDSELISTIEEFQRTLTYYMGELSAGAEHLASYSEKYTSVTLKDVEKLNAMVLKLEKILPKQKDWVLYGGSLIGSQFDFASKVCRRAERSVVSLLEDMPIRPELLQYINRMSDLLYLMARKQNN